MYRAENSEPRFVKRNVYLKLLILIFITSLFTFQTIASEESELLPVIVKLKVPGIQALTDQSMKFKVIHPGKSFDAKGRQADARLKEAIQAVTDDVIAQLDGTYFVVNRTYVTLPLLALAVDQESYSRLHNMKEVLKVIEDRKIPRIAETHQSKSSPLSHSNRELSTTKLDSTIGIIGADEAWNMGFTGQGWYIAVVDCGILSSHEMFSGKTIVEKCYSIWNHCPNNQNEMTGTGAAAQHPSTYLYYDHGTKVAAIAAGNNGFNAPGNDLYGVAKDANIIAVKVCSRDSSDGDPGTVGIQPFASDQISDTISGLEYIYTIRGSYPIAAVNLSLGYGPSDYTSDQESEMVVAINHLLSVGIPTVAATGNGNSCTTLRFPANFNNAIAVGASTNNDERWVNTITGNGSNLGTPQNYYAPGDHVMTADGSGNYSYSDEDSGTSLAAPHVTGAWTIMKQAFPNASYYSLIFALQFNGVPIPPGCTGGATKPRIQIDDAIRSLQEITVNTPTSGTFARNSTVSIDWDSQGITGNVLIAALDGSSSWLLESAHPYDSTPYLWTIPSDFPLGTCQIQVSKDVYGYSEEFEIVKNQNIVVTSPIAGQSVSVGKNLSITWTTTGITGNVSISAITSTQTILLADSHPYNGSPFVWSIPKLTATGDCRIQISQGSLVANSGIFQLTSYLIKPIVDEVPQD